MHANRKANDLQTVFDLCVFSLIHGGKETMYLNEDLQKSQSIVSSCAPLFAFSHRALLAPMGTLADLVHPG